MASSVFLGLYGPTVRLNALTLETEPGAATPQDATNAPLLLMGGTLLANAFIEVHNRHAWGADFYVHNDPGFKAPYLNLYKSRGSQSAPTPPTVTGYELDSLGGINFGGYDGTVYRVGAAILSQTDEDWSGSSHHGAHLSIYQSSVGGANVNQVIQFGGLDPTDTNARNFSGVSSNIISYRPFSFNGNQATNPMMKPMSGATPRFAFRNAKDTGDADVTCGGLTTSGGAVSYGANDSAGAGFRLVRVPNA